MLIGLQKAVINSELQNAVKSRKKKNQVRNDGGKKSYQITFSKDKYQPITLPIKTSANGWYIGGNIIFGGLIGWLVVDPFNGGMYTLHPKETNAVMNQAAQ